MYFLFYFVVVVLTCVKHLLPSTAFTCRGRLACPESAARENSPSSLHPMRPIGDNTWGTGSPSPAIAGVYAPGAGLAPASL